MLALGDIQAWCTGGRADNPGHARSAPRDAAGARDGSYGCGAAPAGTRAASRRGERKQPASAFPGSLTRFLMVAVTLCTPVVGLAAPTPPPGPQVQARLLVPDSVIAGAKVTIVLEVALGPGWHVNSHRPLQSFLIPTSAALTTSSGTLAEVRYPGPVMKRFEFSDEPLSVYEGTVRFESELAVASTATGHVDLGGVLSYQPCNETQCFPPAKKTLSATVAVAGARAKGK